MFPDAPPQVPELPSTTYSVVSSTPSTFVAPVPPSVVLPARLPAQCFLSAATDYVVPPMVLVAMVKHESRGRSVARVNTNGTVDSGVAQINDASWGRYMQSRYNISTQALMSSPCQSIRVMAYVLRMEMNSRECAGTDVWCAVGRYHAPNSLANRALYVPKVKSALTEIERTRRFE